MTTRTRGKKRARSPTANNSNKNKKRKTGLQLIELSEYHCCVCKDLSTNKIFQCPNGCIICSQCYVNIIPCKCPLCRVQMSKTKPIRCRIAERTLGLRLVKCGFKKCNKEVMFSNLFSHENNDCEFKPVQCKFNILGCQWSGLRQNQIEHESECECDQEGSLLIAQGMKDKLEMYRKFLINCKKLRMDSIYISSNDVFNESAAAFYIGDCEYRVHIKSEKTKVRRKETYQIYAKFELFEDVDQVDEDDLMEIEIGIIVEPHGEGEYAFMKELKASFLPLTLENMATEWSPFEQQMSKDEYVKLFRGGFELRMFLFNEV